MNYSIIPSLEFKRLAKKLFKKYPSLKTDLEIFEKELIKNPESGDYLGNNTYKVRIAIKSKGKGKSGGARIYTYVILHK